MATFIGIVFALLQQQELPHPQGGLRGSLSSCSFRNAPLSSHPPSQVSCSSEDLSAAPYQEHLYKVGSTWVAVQACQLQRRRAPSQCLPHAADHDPSTPLLIANLSAAHGS